jgi:hypothetical protein
MQHQRTNSFDQFRYLQEQSLFGCQNQAHLLKQHLFHNVTKEQVHYIDANKHLFLLLILIQNRFYIFL